MKPPVEELLFTAAAGFVDPLERRSFLDFACRDDEKLRTRLDDLLQVQDAADGFFEFEPDVEAPGTSAQTADQEGLGARIGRYRLIMRIGTGGCGVVYLAEQEEP